jgi:septum formation protein
VLLDTATGRELSHLDLEHLRMRDLTLSERRNYVAREDVLGCAGSYRIEGLGIALFESISLPDFTGVIGLPLLAVVRLLREVGIHPLE